MQLTEERASQMIAEWAKDDVWLAPSRPLRTSASPFTPASMVIASTKERGTISQVKQQALNLRRVMEGLNALAVCAGFGVEENPSFWRRELERLGKKRSPGHDQHILRLLGLDQHHLVRLTDGIFSHFKVTTRFNASATPTSALAHGYLTCLAMDQASAAVAVRNEVFEQLRANGLTTPPLLDMTIIGPSDPSMSLYDWGHYFRMLQELDRVQAVMCGTEQVNISVGCEKGAHVPLHGASENLRILQALGDTNMLKVCRVVEVHGFLYGIPTAVSRFRSLMEAFCSMDTIESLTWGMPTSGASSGIFFSAVASMRSLKVLNVQDICCGDRANSIAYEWLAFVLTRRQQQGLPLVLSAEFGHDTAKVFANAMRPEKTSACLIPSEVRATAKFDCFPVGTTAQTTDGAAMTQGMLVDRVYQSSRTADGSRLDVLARSGSRYVVVVPGSGLMWIDAHALGEVTLPHGALWGRKRSPQHSLVVRRSRLCDVVLVASAVEFDRMTVEVNASRKEKHDATKHTGQFSPRCRSLQLRTSWDAKVGSLGAFLREFVGSMASVETLDVQQSGSRLELANPRPWFDVVTDPTNPIARTLRELSVNSLVLSVDCAEALAAALSTNRRLRFLRLWVRANKDERARLETLFTVSLGPTDRSKASLFAFLLCARRSPHWLLLPRECSRLVAAFGTTYAQRQVLLHKVE